MINVEAIKAKAKLMRIPLSELADKIGYSEAGLHRAFSLERVNLRMIVNISQALRMELQDFVTDEKLLQALNSVNVKYHASDEKISNYYEERMVNSYIERINSLTQGLNAYQHQMEIKDEQIKKKDEQLELVLKVLVQKDEMIEGLTKRVSTLFDQTIIKDETK